MNVSGSDHPLQTDCVTFHEIASTHWFYSILRNTPFPGFESWDERIEEPHPLECLITSKVKFEIDEQGR